MNEIEFENHFYTYDLPELLASPLFREVDRRKCAFLIKRGMPAGGAAVLSLGSGDGRKEIGIAGRAAAILGVDICPVAVSQAQARARESGFKHVEFRRDDVRRLECMTAEYDLIIAIGIFHHLDDAAVRGILAKSLLWLKPGGVFITNDPQDRRLVGLFRGVFKSKYRRYHSAHEQELNAAVLARHFRQAGFSGVRVDYTDFFLDPLAWVFPKFPAWLVGPAKALDDAMLAVPGLRGFASHFSIVARK